MQRTVRDWGIDLVVYLCFTVFALGTALAGGYYGHRVWGNFATAGYGLAAAHSGWLLLWSRRGSPPPRWWASRWLSVAVAFVVAMVAPLTYLVVRRVGGTDWLDTPQAWAAQPEVWVIERSASLLLHTGTPYLDVGNLGRPPTVDDYTPYGPVMPMFGMPRAALIELGWADSAVGLAMTDARVVFAVVAGVCVAVCLRLLGRPAVPIAAAQLALIFPAAAQTWAVAGPDLAILGLLLLSVVLATTAHPGSAGLMLAVVVSAKLTAAPAVLVLAIMLAARDGRGALGRFVAAFVVACTGLNLPVALVDPRAAFDNVVAFPAGSGAVSSPAASPLPGHLIAGTGPTGHVIALVLLGIAAVAITAWLVVRPPRTGADAMLRIAVGLGTATLLTPATRWGYLVYPLVLLGARLVMPADREEPGAPTPGQGRTAPGDCAENLPASTSSS